MKNNLLAIIDKMQEGKILVIGDMIADIYQNCTISRISREAPVLVLEEDSEKFVAGGAANVVHNVATLGGRAFAAGIVGYDRAAEGLQAILTASEVDLTALIQCNENDTISKTRVIAGGRTTVSQQIVRIDKEWHNTLLASTTDRLILAIEKMLPMVKGVILSDYGSGTVNEAVKNFVIEYCCEHNIPSMVDSRYGILNFAGIDYVKQNDSEAGVAVGYKLQNKADVVSAGKELLKKLKAKGILITLGEKGMMLFEADGSEHTIPVSDKSEVFDVSGAGDTCVATFMLAIGAGATPRDAAVLSNIAAGIAVRKMGTATVSLDELKSFVKKWEK